MSITPSGVKDFTFYNRPAYFSELVTLCNKSGSGDRILVASMGFEPEHVPHVVAALARASERGAHVTLIFDAYAITYANRTPLLVGSFVWPGVNPRMQGRKHRAITGALNRLRKSGVHCVITNQPHSLVSPPFVGRSHIKTAIFNNHVFIGGINLHEPTYFDEMISFVSPQTADWLYTRMSRLIKAPYTLQAFGEHDLTYAIDANTTLLLDVGVRGQSTILQHALDLIDNAQKQLLITCQYFPNGQTALALKRAAARGVDVTVLYNLPYKHGILEAPAQLASEGRERMRLPKKLFENHVAPHQPFMHAKVLASEREAMVGSHNFISAGVTFGTAELAMHRKDPQFAQDAAQYIANQVHHSPR
ncbi:MAG TPA: phospholipase D-like domain-containing protein [Candidatus Saccharimonadales bacterium]|nr:phospholipase D-like domain-containing protein [Candidatus Saccharimonadales bacterium]